MIKCFAVVQFFIHATLSHTTTRRPLHIFLAHIYLSTYIFICLIFNFYFALLAYHFNFVFFSSSLLLLSICIELRIASAGLTVVQTHSTCNQRTIDRFGCCSYCWCCFVCFTFNVRVISVSRMVLCNCVPVQCRQLKNLHKYTANGVMGR